MILKIKSWMENYFKESIKIQKIFSLVKQWEETIIATEGRPFLSLFVSNMPKN